MPDVVDFYWSVVVAIAGAAWVLMLFVRDRMTASATRSSELIRRVHEIDRLIIEQPAIQKYLSTTMSRDEAYFRAPEVLQDDDYYRAKALAYWHLNLFDELLSTENHCGWWKRLSPQVWELVDWHTYIKHKCKHPLFRSILNNEGKIFGAALQEFWSANKASVEAAPVDPYTW